jgi:hypothetical protein
MTLHFTKIEQPLNKYWPKFKDTILKIYGPNNKQDTAANYAEFLAAIWDTIDTKGSLVTVLTGTEPKIIPAIPATPPTARTAPTTPDDETTFPHPLAPRKIFKNKVPKNHAKISRQTFLPKISRHILATFRNIRKVYKNKDRQLGASRSKRCWVCFSPFFSPCLF